MQKLECPHCHERTISFWRKQWLGPGSTTACQSCGGKVSVPGSASWLAMAPFFIAVAVAPRLGSFPRSLFTFLAGSAISAVLYSFVPLIRR
jgi:hypothetical protein